MWFRNKSKSSVTIPDRNEGQFAQQYAQVVDVNRLTQIYQESGQLAVKSRNPETAHSRYDLAIECYYQIMSLPTSRRLRKSTKNATDILVSRFPSQVCMNEALGLCDKANKVKTIKTQHKHLKKAEQLLKSGLDKRDVGYDNIMSIYVQVEEYIKKAEEQLDKI